MVLDVGKRLCMQVCVRNHCFFGCLNPFISVQMYVNVGSLNNFADLKIVK